MPSKNVDKAYAIISCMGSALRSVEYKTADYTRLADRINKMMQVYSFTRESEKRNEAAKAFAQP